MECAERNASCCSVIRRSSIPKDKRPRLYDRSLLLLLPRHPQCFYRSVQRREGHRRAERSDKRQREPFMSFLSSDFMRYVSYRRWILLLCRAIRLQFTAMRRIRRISTLPYSGRDLSFPFDLSPSSSPLSRNPGHPCYSCTVISRCKRAFIQVSNHRTVCRLIARASIPLARP